MTVNDQDPYSVNHIDRDPEETTEWNDSLEAVVESQGHERGREIMLSLLKKSKDLHLGVPMVPTTDYINTIAPENEPEFPGNEDIERRYRAWLRWNAAVTVHRAQRPGIAVGGHISTYASSAALYEVGHNHFFRGQNDPSGGDQIFYQGHASPGMYARAFLEGRLGPDQLDGWTLGADNFGFSDTRAAARRYFKIDGPSLVVRTLESLARRGEIDRFVVGAAIEKYRLLDVTAGTTGSAGGES